MTQQSHSQAYILKKPSILLFTAAIARTWKQPKYPWMGEWIKNLWYIYTMEYYSAIKMNAFKSVLMRWMNQEPIIQKMKDQYRILRHIYGIQKNDTEEFTYRPTMEKQTQRIDLWTWGEGNRG